MAQLAIKGHATRGKKVIEILGILGGSNAFGHIGNNPRAIYYIDENYKNFIICSKAKEVCDYIIFTLEEFLEKFPYKVGDKVKNVRINDFVGRIINARWDNNEEQIIYTVEWDDATKSTLTYFARGLQPYKEESMEEKKINQMSLANCDLDEVEIILGDKFELKIKEGKCYAVKKQPRYPKTYEECCNILGCKANHFFTDFSYNGCDVEISDYEDKIDDLLQIFRKLRYYRDVYWKIAGDLMGLGKPWEPDYNEECYEQGSPKKYVIYYTGTHITKGQKCTPSYFLAFPTAEMRDAFYENFKELIENCKELL